jgi:DNA mismatch repair protein MutL
MRLEGYIGKPEFSKKNRGEQYFFVNNRFIKDGYLHHAVVSAFESLIPKDSYPSYWLKITIDPAEIDVNIHPTKTEIKFIDDKSVYAILRAAVKRALGRFSIAPSLDFENEKAFDIPLSKLESLPVQPSIRINPNYNPFKPETTSGNSGFPKREINWSEREQPQVRQWSELNQSLNHQFVTSQEEISENLRLSRLIDELDDFRFVQVGLRLLCVNHTQGVLLVDIQGAHERILYEKYVQAFDSKQMPAQQQLFPPQLQLSHDDALLLNELGDDLKKLGFDLADFGNNVVVIQGIPADLEAGEETKVLQQLLEQYRNNKDRLQLNSRENLARSMARSVAIKQGQMLAHRELKHLAVELLQCENPLYGISGKQIFVSLNADELMNHLQG